MAAVVYIHRHYENRQLFITWYKPEP